MGVTRIEIRSGRMTRYTTGCRAADQDRQAVTRSARASKQDYHAIRDQHFKAGTLFEDPDFPAVDSSVFYSQPRRFEWKRPKEICDDARMFVGGASRFDIKQGDLGNCWFLAAVASLCASSNRMKEGKGILHKVVPKDNNFYDNYGGCVHFNIWQSGRWVDVVIDDKLPTSNGKLVFMHSASPNEFWSALLEKAYAKLMGSYEALRGGCSSEAMEDFTGGVVETFNYTKEVPKDMWKILLKAHDRHSLMACQIDASPAQIEGVLDNGLIMGHAYSVTGVKKLNLGGQEHKLLRIRNPWGNQYEWKGRWGDADPAWKNVSEQQKKDIGLSFDDDGEFWMALDDFTSNYSKLEICNLGPESMAAEMGEEAPKRKWEESKQEGTWKSRVNAGGCRNYLDTFWTNPQFRTQVVDVDEDDEDNTGTVIMALMQKERRKKRAEGIDHLTIGYSIYEITDPNQGPLDKTFFQYNRAAARSTFSNVREVCQRFKLPPGNYCIIPQTFKPGEEGDFLLRIYSERPVPTSEVDEETALIDDEDDAKQAEFDATAPKGTPGAKDVHKVEERRRRQRARAVDQNDVEQEKEVRSIFRRTAGEDMEVDAFELKTILDAHFMKEFKFSGFSLETCRSIVAMKDLDKSGKLGYDEFKAMWAGLRRWKKIFKEFDEDKSGNLNSFELRAALNAAGYKVSNSTFNGLVMRYADQTGKVSFDDYIQCGVRLRTMFDVFKETQEAGKASFTLDQFIQTTMYS